VRRWQEDLLSGSAGPRPDGVFWWNFYNNRNVDEFFTAALEFVTNNKNVLKAASTKRRAQLVASILVKRKFLFVLDGLEVMQYQAGNLYGRIESKYLRDFLLIFGSKRALHVVSLPAGSSFWIY